MAGRGGRGAQLLEALQIPVRKPQNVGQPPPSQSGFNQQSTGSPQLANGQQQMHYGHQDASQQSYGQQYQSLRTGNPGMGPSGMRPQLSGMRYPQPGMRPQQFGMRPQQPGMRPQQPGMQPPQPGMRPHQPGMRAQQPGMRPQQPGMRPQQTEMQLPQQGMRSQQPGMRSSQPAVRSQQPGMVRSQQGMRPQQPGVGPAQSRVIPHPHEIRPPQSGMRPQQHVTGPRQSGGRPGQFGMGQIQYQSRLQSQQRLPQQQQQQQFQGHGPTQQQRQTMPLQGQQGRPVLQRGQMQPQARMQPQPGPSSTFVQQGQFDPRGGQFRAQFQPRGQQSPSMMSHEMQSDGSSMGQNSMVGNTLPQAQHLGQQPQFLGQDSSQEKQLRQPQSFGRGQSLHLLEQATNPQQSPYQSLSQQQQEAPPFQQPQQFFTAHMPSQQSPQQQIQISPQPEHGVSPPTQELQSMSIKAPNTQTGEKGSAGQPVSLAVNYVPIRCRTEGVFQYCVSFSPEVDSRGMRFRLLYEHAEFLGEARGFDGIILFLPYQFQQQPTILKSVRPTDGAEITIYIQLTKFVRLDDSVQFYNIIFKKVMRALQMQQVGRYYYDPTRPSLLPQHKLELWPGYITAIQHYEGGLMLLADVSHRLLRTDNAFEFMNEIYASQKNNFQEAATKALVGSIVLTRYNNNTYRIDDIEWDKNPLSTFTFRNGEEISYVDYYKRTYNREIVNHHQPLLLHRPKVRKDLNKPGKRPPLDTVMLVPELCYLTGLTDTMRSDFRVMKDIAVHTRITPMQRDEAMRKFISNVESTPEAKKFLSIWGLELDRGLLRTEGRLLPSEKIKFGATSIVSNQQADWGREAVKENVITAVALNSWMVVVTKRNQSKAMEFVQMMKNVTPAMGIRVSDPIVLEARDDRTETYLRTIRENLNPGVQMVVVIFPTSRDDRYAAVKKLCCVESPVPSQVINARTISQQNKLRSVTQKIALQINCKLGGELWALDIPLKSLMVVGIDVYHDSSHGGRSVGGFVASTNRSLTRWYSRVCFQNPGQELVDGLKMCFTAALRKFHEINHTLPEKIIVFRDSVGDGQLNTVGGYEVPQMSECFALFGATYQPQLAVVVVHKRINTRIFSVESHGSQQMLENPNPGTVLDHTITRKDWYDFFLISQHVRQGTVSPTHYVVVHNSSSLKPDHMQRLSYKLSHLYYNWPGTVRVPAPCQYAHKIAYLVGTSIHKDPALALSDRLFYL